MIGYTKLFSSIVTSTIWRENLPTKVVWITLLALSDRDGMVEGAVPGLAHLAGVTVEECDRALEILKKPDKYSRSREHEGRRIEPVDGGWLVLNRVKYRDLMPDEHQRERARLRQQRHRQGQGVTERDNNVLSPQKETEKEKEKETKKGKEKNDGTEKKPAPSRFALGGAQNPPSQWEVWTTEARVLLQSGVPAEQIPERLMEKYADPAWSKSRRAAYLTLFRRAVKRALLEVRDAARTPTKRTRLNMPMLTEKDLPF